MRALLVLAAWAASPALAAAWSAAKIIAVIAVIECLQKYGEIWTIGVKENSSYKQLSTRYKKGGGGSLKGRVRVSKKGGIGC